MNADALVCSFVAQLQKYPEVVEPPRRFKSKSTKSRVKPVPISSVQALAFWNESTLVTQIPLSSFVLGPEKASEIQYVFWASLDVEYVAVKGHRESIVRDLFHSPIAPPNPGILTTERLLQQEKHDMVCDFDHQEAQNETRPWISSLQKMETAVSRTVLYHSPTYTRDIPSRFFDLWFTLTQSERDEIWEIRSFLNLTCLGVHRSKRRWTSASERRCDEQFTSLLGMNTIISDNAVQSAKHSTSVLSSTVLIRVPAWHTFSTESSDTVELAMVAKLYTPFGVRTLPISVKFENSLVLALQRMLTHPAPDIQWTILLAEDSRSSSHHPYPPRSVDSEALPDSPHCGNMGRSCPLFSSPGHSNGPPLKPDNHHRYPSITPSDHQQDEDHRNAFCVANPLSSSIIFAAAGVLFCGVLGIALLYYPFAWKRIRRSIAEFVRPVCFHIRRVWRKSGVITFSNMLQSRFLCYVRRWDTSNMFLSSYYRIIEYLHSMRQELIRWLDVLFLQLLKFSGVSEDQCNEFAARLGVKVGRFIFQTVQTFHWIYSIIEKLVSYSLSKVFRSKQQSLLGFHSLDLSSVTLDRAAIDDSSYATLLIETTNEMGNQWKTITRDPSCSFGDLRSRPSSRSQSGTPPRIQRSTAKMRIESPLFLKVPINRLINLHGKRDSQMKHGVTSDSQWPLVSSTTATLEPRLSMPLFLPPRRSSSVWFSQLIVRKFSTTAAFLSSCMRAHILKLLTHLEWVSPVELQGSKDNLKVINRAIEELPGNVQHRDIHPETPRTAATTPHEHARFSDGENSPSRELHRSEQKEGVSLPSARKNIMEMDDDELREFEMLLSSPPRKRKKKKRKHGGVLEATDSDWDPDQGYWVKERFNGLISLPAAKRRSEDNSASPRNKALRDSSTRGSFTVDVSHVHDDSFCF